MSLIACDSNPLGITQISSCDHSPNFKTGLPVTCQVSLHNSENLTLWLDANDLGTVNSENQTDIDSWSDKSGNSTLFTPTAQKAILLKKQVASRSAIKWIDSLTEYISSPLTNYSENQDFTLAVTFKSSSINIDMLEINNGTNNGFSIIVSSDGSLIISLNSSDSFNSPKIIKDEVVSKIILAFKSSTKELFIYGDDNQIGTKIITGNSVSWENLIVSGSEGLELYELLIYSDHLSDFEITELQTYLNNKWGF